MDQFEFGFFSEELDDMDRDFDQIQPRGGLERGKQPPKWASKHGPATSLRAW